MMRRATLLMAFSASASRLYARFSRRRPQADLLSRPGEYAHDAHFGFDDIAALADICPSRRKSEDATSIDGSRGRELSSCSGDRWQSSRCHDAVDAAAKSYAQRYFPLAYRCGAARPSAYSDADLGGLMILD